MSAENGKKPSRIERFVARTENARMVHIVSRGVFAASGLGIIAAGIARADASIGLPLGIAAFTSATIDVVTAPKALKK